MDVTDGGRGRANTAAAAALSSTTIKTGGGNAPRRRHVMNVHWWRASTSVHHKALKYLHLLVDTPISHFISFCLLQPASFVQLSFSLFEFSCILTEDDVGKVEVKHVKTHEEIETEGGGGV